MSDLKLAKLPDRTPVKLTISLLPEVHEAVLAYAAAYAVQYGREEPITELLPAMIAAFLDSDRAFQKARQSKQHGS